MKTLLFILLLLWYGDTTAYRSGILRQKRRGREVSLRDRRPLKSKVTVNLGPLKSRLSETKNSSLKGFSKPKLTSVDETNIKASPAPSASFSVQLEEIGEYVTLWRICVVFLCILWSTNFPIIVQIFNAVPGLTPQVYAAIRFTIAAAVLSPSYLGRLKDVELIKSTFLIGACLFLGFIGQSIGLSFPNASANKSAFLCSCIVVWVTFLKVFLADFLPLSQEFKENNRDKGVSPSTVTSVVLSVLGIGILELQSDVQPTLADLWFCLQPIGFGTGYLLIEDIMRQEKYKDASAAISGLRIFFVAMFSYIWCLSSGSQLSEFTDVFASPTAMKALVYTGVVTTGAGVYLQTQAFKRVTATDASLILSTEPLFTALFSASLINEPIGSSVIIGGVLIILACFVNEIESDWKDLVDIKLTAKTKN